MNTFLGWARAPGALDFLSWDLLCRSEDVVTTLLSCRLLERIAKCEVTSNRFFLFKAEPNVRLSRCSDPEPYP